MRGALMIYSMRTPPRWLRRPTVDIDKELIARCRQQWRRLRARAGTSAFSAIGAWAAEAAQPRPAE